MTANSPLGQTDSARPLSGLGFGDVWQECWRCICRRVRWFRASLKNHIVVQFTRNSSDSWDERSDQRPLCERAQALKRKTSPEVQRNNDFYIGDQCSLKRKGRVIAIYLWVRYWTRKSVANHRRQHLRTLLSVLFIDNNPYMFYMLYMSTYWVPVITVWQTSTEGKANKCNGYCINCTAISHWVDGFQTKKVIKP